MVIYRNRFFDMPKLTQVCTKTGKQNLVMKCIAKAHAKTGKTSIGSLSHIHNWQIKPQYLASLIQDGAKTLNAKTRNANPHPRLEKTSTQICIKNPRK